jgi:hypothetical protein
VKMQRLLGSHPATRFWDASRMPMPTAAFPIRSTMSPPAAVRRRQNGPCESQRAGWPGEAIRSQMMMTPPYPVSLNHRCLHKQPHDRGLASALLSCLLCCAGRRPTYPLSLLLASPFCCSAPSPSQPPTTRPTRSRSLDHEFISSVFLSR